MLRPEIAALSMPGSSFLVAVNAQLLKRLRLPSAADIDDNDPRVAQVAPDTRTDLVDSSGVTM